ncbi:MAG TPA: hypothetical protein VJR29_12360 [bacterium]|nr:hypothetical protein [bacterium]
MGGGNYAAGPVSLSTPVTVNKDLIVCENIAGPDVRCRGRVSPHAKVQLSVHAPGFSKNFFEGLFLGVAHAAPLSAIVSADANGFFQAAVGAGPGQAIEIRSAASRLVLTVPQEGESVSGVMGLMKNMTVDSKGSVWFSGVLPPAKPASRFSLAKLFISEAHAETASPSSSISEIAASCPGTVPPVAPAGEPSSRCEIKRLPPGADSPETVASFEGCTQADVRFIRPWEGNDRWVLAGVRDSVYVVDLEAVPPKVTQRIRFPAPVLGGSPMGGHLYVTVGGAEAAALSLFRISGPGSEGFQPACVLGESLPGKLAVYQGIQEVVSSDTWGSQFVSVGRFTGDYRVLTGALSSGDQFKIGPKEIFRSVHRLEAAVVTGNFGFSDKGIVRTYFAVLSSEEKKLHIIEDENSLDDSSFSRTQVYSFDLSAYVAPYSLAVDRDLMRIAFLDHGPAGARMAVVPLRFTDGVQLDLAAAKFQELGNVVPSALVRISDEVYQALQEAPPASTLPESAPSPESAPQAPIAARVYTAPVDPPPAPPAPDNAEVEDEAVPWLVNTQGTQIETFDKGNPAAYQRTP